MNSSNRGRGRGRSMADAARQVPVAGLAALLMLAGCGGAGTVTSDDVGDVASADVRDLAADAGAEVGVDAADVDFGPGPEVGEVDETFEAESVEAGGFGWPCTSNADCVSGFCVETEGGNQCTVTCVEECPSDWSCVQNLAAMPDVVYICVPGHTRLCVPCLDHAVCNPPGLDLGDRCVELGDAGSFCGAACTEAADCPQGFLCAEESLAGGGTGMQCVPDGAACECSGLAVQLGAWTECRATNENGACPGKTQCLEEGPAACDAPMPEAEACDGNDNDCDGEADEGLGSTECGMGVCLHSTENCVGGEALTCDPMEGAGQEKCNGLDDNCDGETDEEFPDADSNGEADCISEDDDGDGVPDSADNCPLVVNSDQFDTDYDTVGDACDPDDDDDKVPDETDCAPLDSEIFPGATEVCDGKDNDCDSDIDEGFGSVTCGLGACKHTVVVCETGQVAVCDPFEGVAEEACDGKDNDCDGDSDEKDALGCQLYFLDVDQDSFGVDGQSKCLCAPEDFYQAVVAGDCKPLVPEINPGAEDKCDGQDNDCDGSIDEGFENLDNDELADCVDPDDDDDNVPDLIDNCPITSNYNQANFDKDQFGDVCDWDDDNDATGDLLDCDPFDPLIYPGADEVCNGKDDDCDSAKDEELGTLECGVGECFKVVPACLNGKLNTCEPKSTGTEVCDGKDNDCDGKTDEELGTLTCGKGECVATVDACVGGQPQVCEPKPVSDEVCDGKDNNCDGQIDETFPEQGIVCPVPNAKGECAKGTYQCANGKTTCPQVVQPNPEQCDGKDNNCDGQIDEIFPEQGQLCVVPNAVGVCAAGSFSCTNGQKVCAQVVQPQPEQCDGKDNNCDGMIDETFPDQGKSCTVPNTKGECAKGTNQCTMGLLTCPQVVQPQPEQCDGKDNSCDGQIDEDGATGCIEYFPDSDLDGFGDPSGKVCACAMPQGFVTKSGDCNDNSNKVYLGAPEICGNGVDEDCDGKDCTVVGDSKWQLYRKTGMSQNPDTYMPVPADFGSLVGTVADAQVFSMGCSSCVEGWRTWVYVTQPTSFPLCVWGDDGVSFYRNDVFVCGRPNAEDPKNCATPTLDTGWNKLEALSYNGPGPGHFDMDVLMGSKVTALKSTGP